MSKCENGEVQLNMCSSERNKQKLTDLNKCNQISKSMF